MTALMEPCWVCYDGIDVVNSGRARAYWSAMGGNACGPGCGSRWASGLCGPDGETYTDPFTDDLTGNVWWLDPSQPGYDDIIGITGTELSVSHGVRTGVGVTSWGGHAGPTRYGPMGNPTFWGGPHQIESGHRRGTSDAAPPPCWVGRAEPGVSHRTSNFLRHATATEPEDSSE
jgi:hypothetical protein